MTQEEIKLLLKDLSARLPYGVICKWKNDGYSGGGELIDICKVKTSKGYIYWDCYFEDENDDIPIEIVKPYLRPMSSMTEEEAMEYANCGNIIANSPQNNYLIPNPNCVDWLNSHHFDYRGMIEKGLAIEASEGMYE